MLSNIDVRVWGIMQEFDTSAYSVVKHIKADRNSSLQYHPKAKECWYFLKESMILLEDRNKGEVVLRHFRAGEVVEIEKCVIHALLEGAEVIEFKEFEDETRRVFDWGRVRDE